MDEKEICQQLASAWFQQYGIRLYAFLQENNTAFQRQVHTSLMEKTFGKLKKVNEYV